MAPDDLISILGQVLHDKKAINILALDVRHVSNMADYFLIAEGNVDRHVQSLAKAIEEELTAIGWPIHYIEGMEEGDWIVIDCWAIVIHLFVPELRQKYQLERLWEKADLVELKIEWNRPELSEMQNMAYPQSLH